MECTPLRLTLPFLPKFNPAGTFDLIVYTDSDSAVPSEWEESDPRVIARQAEVRAGEPFRILFLFLFFLLAQQAEVKSHVDCSRPPAMHVLPRLCLPSHLAMLKHKAHSPPSPPPLVSMAQVKLRSFSTRVHRVDALVAYRDDDGS